MDSLLKNQLWWNRGQQPSDVDLIIKNRSYPCHRAIFSARSPVFLELLKVNPNLIQVHIDEVDPLTTDADVEHFLEFVYTGQLLIAEYYNLPLLKLAKTFKLIYLGFLW
jgi:hypothetical protein